MAYIGRTPTIGNFVILDSITTSATDTYALTSNSVAYFPASANHCIVSLNGVIQAPFSSYTISGSNIVFDSALTGSDSIDFITVLGDVLNVGTVSDGTITTAKLADSSVSLAKLTATGTKDATTFLRGDNTFAVAGGTNTPAFSATQSGAQGSIATNTWTKLQFATEIFDTDNCYDPTTNYRFTPTTAGKYFFHASIVFDDTSDFEISLNIRKNGSGELNGGGYFSFYNSVHVNGIAEANGSSDYFEVYLRHQKGSNASTYGAGKELGLFQAYKIIE